MLGEHFLHAAWEHSGANEPYVRPSCCALHSGSLVADEQRLNIVHRNEEKPASGRE